MNLDEMTLDIQQEAVINGGIDDVFKTVIHRFGKGGTTPDGGSMQMDIEEFAGGRWFRDRGDGIQHLWGHVQVIKPPTLLELSGPMFMSYPAQNHVEIKVEKTAGGSRVTLRHRALGMIDPEHRKGVGAGWGHMLAELKKDAE